jgi:hypothetical protein
VGVSDLRGLTDLELERYLDTDEGRADSRVDTEILIRLFKARRVTIDELLAHRNPRAQEVYGYDPVTGIRVW